MRETENITIAPIAKANNVVIILTFVFIFMCIYKKNVPPLRTMADVHSFWRILYDGF